MATLGLASPVSMSDGLLALLLLTAGAVISRLGTLIAVVVTLPYFYAPIGIGTQEFAVSELLLVAVVAGSPLRVLADMTAGHTDIGTIVNDVRALLRSRLIQLLFALMVVGAVSTLLAFDTSARDASLREWRWSLVEPLVLLVLLSLFVRHRTARALLAAGLIAAGVVAASHALLDVVTGAGVSADNVRRLSGPLPHPNALALFLVRPFVLAAALFVLAPRLRPYVFIPMALTGMALFGTFSRGAMIAVIVAAAILALGMPRRIQVAIGSASALVVALGVVVAGDRMRNAFEGGSVSLRLDIWESSLHMIRDRPVVGYGPDQFLYAYAPRYIQPTAWDERFTSHAHNLIADSWIRLGFIGALAALFVLWFVVRRLVDVNRDSSRSGLLERSALVALAAVLVHGMIDNAIFAHDLAMSAWLLGWLAFPPRMTLSERRGAGG